jgi:hypothetical protein
MVLRWTQREADMSDAVEQLVEEVQALSWVVLALIAQLEDQHGLDTDRLATWLRSKAGREDGMDRKAAARVLRLTALVLDRRDRQ